jgi:hypothetical protein
VSRRGSLMLAVIQIPDRCRIGRRTVFALILMSILCGCSLANIVTYPWAKDKKEILKWAASEKPKVDRGTLKNSKYWEEFYRKSLELRPDLDDFLCYSAEMTKVSIIFEEGKITKEQFEDKGRELKALFAREEDRRDPICPAGVFGCYRGSVLTAYIRDLETKLNKAGPQFSISHCAFFGKSIQCATERPPFY